MCELVKQVSTAECVVGSTFGCVANAALSGPQVWVTGGCRGTFRVSGSTVIGCSQRQHNRFLFSPRGIHRCAGHPATDKQSVGSKVAVWAAQMLSKLSLASLPDNRMMRSVFNYSDKDTTRNHHRGQGGVGSIGNMSDSSGTCKVRPAARLCCDSTSQRRPFGLRCQCDERFSTLQPGATTKVAGSTMHFEVGYINYFNSSNVRSGAKWYALQTRRMLRSIASLRLSGYASLVHVVLGGERVAEWEDAHACDPKVVVHRTASSAFLRPSWSSPFHRASFEKVWILHLSAQLEKPLLFLDNDVVVFRPLDELRHARPPAYVVKPREGINSGVMLLRETPETLARRLDAYSIVEGGGDRGEQRLVNVFHQASEFFELPAAYNTYTSDVDTAVPRWWDQIVLWHKPTEKGHLMGEARAYVNSHLKRVEAEAARSSPFCSRPRARKKFTSSSGVSVR